MGKDEASLKDSRDISAMLKERWGLIPSSIMRARWDVHALDLSKSYQDQKQASEFADTPFSLSSVGARHGGLSRMPQNIVSWASKFYMPDRLPEGDRGYFGNSLPTVLDPFAGHLSRAEAVWRCNRNYVGWDICKEFQEMNRKAKEQLEDENAGRLFDDFRIEARMEFVEKDSRLIDYDGLFDFCISSPPFWCLEDYGPEPEQLSNHKTYEEFLASLGEIIKSCYRALKPGSFIAMEFNDFRREGRWHPFHADGMERFKRAGFILHDIIIIDYGSGFLEAFPSDIDHHHVVSKEHSYLVIGRKRPEYRRPKRQKTRERLLAEVEMVEKKKEEGQVRLL